MRYVLVLIVVVWLVWRWRAARAAALQEHQQAMPNRPTVPGSPHTMVACAHCGVHVPVEDLFKGAHGVYCSAAHRQHAEG